MSEDLESKLRSSLRPIAPSADFEKKLVAAVAEQRRYARPQTSRFLPASWHSRAGWLSAAVAASLLLAVGVQNAQQRRERETGLEARRQVVEALRMTSQKLDLAYETVKNQSTSWRDENPGA